MQIDDLGSPGSYWKRPIAKTKGDPDSRVTYMAVGNALTVWEIVETYLGIVYLTLIQTRSEAARRSYGSIETPRGRRDAIKAAAESYFLLFNGTVEDQRRFDLLLEHAAHAAARRNDIAHGSVITVQIEGVNRGSFLCPATYRTKGNDLIPVMLLDPESTDEFGFLTAQFRFTSADMVQISSQFEKLYQAVAEMNLRLMKLWQAKQ